MSTRPAPQAPTIPNRDRAGTRIAALEEGAAEDVNAPAAARTAAIARRAIAMSRVHPANLRAASIQRRRATRRGVRIATVEMSRRRSSASAITYRASFSARSRSPLQRQKPTTEVYRAPAASPAAGRFDQLFEKPLSLFTQWKASSDTFRRHGERLM